MHFRTLFLTLFLTILIDAEKIRLADGTKFERYVETGQDDLPPLPADEDEADDLNDPRIGHLDEKGSLIIPVDENGKVLAGYEYLLKPIDITVDLDEEPEEGGKLSRVITQEDGEEYDDVPSEPQDPAPKVPDLPKPDYSDSEESREDLEDDRAREVLEKVEESPVDNEVVEEPRVLLDTAEESRVEDEIVEESGVQSVEDGKEIIVPSTRIEPPSISESEGLTEEDIQQLALEFSRDISEKVMNKAWDVLEEDPNSVKYQAESEGDVVDGVILPDQVLTDDEIAKIAAESLVPEEPERQEESQKTIVRGGRIGGVGEPDSAVQFKIFMQFLLVSLAIFAL